MAIRIDQNWLANQNPEKSKFQHLTDYVATTDGFSSSVQAIYDAVQLGNEVGKEGGFVSSKTLTDLESNLGTTLSVLPLARLPSSTNRAFRSLADLIYENGVKIGRKAMNAGKNIAEFLSDSCWAAALFSKNPVFKNTGHSMDFAWAAISLPIAYDSYNNASNFESQTVGETKTAFQHSKNYYLLDLARNVIFATSGIFGFIGFATGATLLSAIAFSVFSLSAGIFGIMRDVARESGKYPVIDFDREVRV